jgi:hypothetical protein
VCRTLRRFAVPVALALLFLLVPNPPARAASEGSAFRFTEWLEMLTRLWAPEGCGFDPGGSCRNGNSTQLRDEGCGLDPGGKCAATPIWAQGGCIIDPSGACRDGVLPQRDAGCVIDTGGYCAQ